MTFFNQIITNILLSELSNLEHEFLFPAFGNRKNNCGTPCKDLGNIDSSIAQILKSSRQPGDSHG